MTRLSDQIQGIDDSQKEKVTIQWGDVEVDLELRGLTLAESGAITKDPRVKADDDAYATARWVIAGTFDPEDGTPAFGESDADMLMGKSAKIVGDLAEKILRLSGIETRRMQAEREAGIAANPTGESSLTSATTQTSETPSPLPES